MILTILKVRIRGTKYRVPSPKSGKLNLKNPYPPSFSKIPASRTDPDTGAST